jgi:DNA polymerase-3 subunit epsilon
MVWRSGRLLGFDLETTGLDTSRDLPVQVALVWADPSGGAWIDSWLVDPGRAIPDEAIAIHGITTDRARSQGCSLREAAVRIHAAFRRAAGAGVPVVAMNASFDVTIAEALFATFGLPALAWRALLDPLVMDRQVDRHREGNRRLDALCEHYRVRLDRAHDARSDAEAAVAITRRIGYRYEECGEATAEELTILQASWHECWATDHDSWLRAQGLPGLEPFEFSWPCRRVPAASTGAAAAVSPELELARSRHPTLARGMGSRSVA